MNYSRDSRGRWYRQFTLLSHTLTYWEWLTFNRGTDFIVRREGPDGFLMNGRKHSYRKAEYPVRIKLTRERIEP